MERQEASVNAKITPTMEARILRAMQRSGLSKTQVILAALHAWVSENEKHGVPVQTPEGMSPVQTGIGIEYMRLPTVEEANAFIKAQAEGGAQ